MPLFDPASTSALPAPYWFVELFKTLGFALHLIPMGVMLVGLPCCVLFWLFGGVNSRRLAQRLFQQFPIFVALCINFGIVPLLFVQLAYSKAFYSSTIIVAAHWLGFLPILFLAYCACYFCANGAKKEKKWSTLFFACFAILCFYAIGAIFSSVWTFFERPCLLWRTMSSSSRVIDALGGLTLGGLGTASGLGVFWRDPIIYVRFAGVVGLAFYAFAFWIVFDAFCVYGGPRKLTDEEELALLEAEETATDDSGKSRKRKRMRAPIQENPDVYPYWALSAACCLVFLGALVAFPALGDYLVNKLSAETVFSARENWNPVLWKVLFYGTFSFLVLPLVFLILGKLRKISGKALALSMVVCELGLVGFYATLRQTIQNLQLEPYFNAKAADDSSAVQWSPILAFLGVFVVTIFIVGLIVSLTAKTRTRLPGDGKKTKPAKKEKKSATNKKKAKSAKEEDTAKNGEKPTSIPQKQKESRTSASSNASKLTLGTSSYSEVGARKPGAPGGGNVNKSGIRRM